MTSRTYIPQESKVLSQASLVCLSISLLFRAPCLPFSEEKKRGKTENTKREAGRFQGQIRNPNQENNQQKWVWMEIQKQE
jgi:hypothetical protein